MSFFSAVVAIVAIVAVAWLRAQKLRHEGGAPDSSARYFERGADRDAYTNELEREVVALKKRLEVLERIATDDTRRLSHEIEKLRDS